MQLFYILSLGHSGSTLLDCILGTHPDILSSGELRYLNWQLERTKNKQASIQDQDICTCEKDFRDCCFWSEVFKVLYTKTGDDIILKPTSFDTAYFNIFSYQERGGFKRSYLDKLKQFIFLKWVGAGLDLESILKIEPRIIHQLKNNWLLYEAMAEVSGKSIVVDSSKNILIGLLLQQQHPDQVTFLFLHRSIEGLVASAKRWGGKNNRIYSIENSIQSKKKFDKKIYLIKNRIKKLKWFDIKYEDFVRKPSDFLDKISVDLKISPVLAKQANDQFYIDPSKMHLVAGNPMRYRGNQMVRYDDRWRDELDQVDMRKIKELYYS